MKKNLVKFLSMFFFLTMSHSVFATSFWDLYCVTNYGIKLGDVGLFQSGETENFGCFSRSRNKAKLTEKKRDIKLILELNLQTVQDKIDLIVNLLTQESLQHSIEIAQNKLKNLHNFADRYFQKSSPNRSQLSIVIRDLEYFSQLFNTKEFQSEFEHHGTVINHRLKQYIDMINESLSAYKKFLLYTTGYLSLESAIDIRVDSALEAEKVENIFFEYCENFQKNKVFLYDPPKYAASNSMISPN